MSEEGRKAGQRATEYLGEADYSLKRAAEFLKKANDGETLKKVEKIQKDVSTTQEDLGKKLGGPKQGG